MYVSKQTKVQIRVERMLSERWSGMFALWTNYDIKEKYPVFKLTAKWSKVKKFMNELLNEGLPPDSERSEPLWWWSMDNNFVSHLLLLRLVIYSDLYFDTGSPSSLIDVSSLFFHIPDVCL